MVQSQSSAFPSRAHLVMYLGQLGVHILSTPTPPEEGWGRQNVETNLVTMWTGIVCDATSTGNS